MSTPRLRIDAARPVYAADHTGRPTNVGERRMCPLFFDGVLAGYLFSPVENEIILRLTKPDQVLVATVDQLDQESAHGDQASQSITDGTKPSLLTDETSRAAGHAEAAPDRASGARAADAGHPEGGAAQLRPSRGGPAGSTDGRAPASGGTDAGSGAEADAAHGERELGVPHERLRVGARVGAVCETCQWSSAMVVVDGATMDEAYMRTMRTAWARHQLESLGCDAPILTIDQQELLAAYVHEV